MTTRSAFGLFFAVVFLGATVGCGGGGGAAACPGSADPDVRKCGEGAGAFCTDVSRDPDNCGACGTICGQWQECSAGGCVDLACPGADVDPNVRKCGEGSAGVCTNVSTDAENCGACGTVCGLWQECSAGGCVDLACPGADVDPNVRKCGESSAGVCTNVSTDAENCGACGTVCGLWQACFEGACANIVCDASSLTTTYSGGNGNHGVMFDVVAVSDVRISGFDVNIAGSGTLLVYHRTGTYSGFETDAAAWGELANVSVTSAGSNTATALPITLSVIVRAGERHAFYITGNASGAEVTYSNGTAADTVAAADANLEVREGRGMGYPFTVSSSPRIFNGTVHYDRCE